VARPVSSTTAEAMSLTPNDVAVQQQFFVFPLFRQSVMQVNSITSRVTTATIQSNLVDKGLFLCRGAAPLTY
jgi:hypothetical protein